MIDVILDNINHILNGSLYHNLKDYVPALQEDMNRWNFYKRIAQKLNERIGGVN